METTRSTPAPPAAETQADRLDSDFSKLWIARALSDAGTALAMGALPLIAIRALDATTFQVSLITVAAGLAGALFALPMGQLIESHRKRPAMIIADLLRATVIAAVPLLAWLDLLAFWHLLVVSAVTALGRVVFGGASSAHLKNLVAQEKRPEALGKLESTFWLFNAIGPALGGGLIQLFGLTTTMVMQAVGYLASALGIRAIRRPEPEPAAAPSRLSLSETLTGFTTAMKHPVLRPLFLNSLLFAAFIGWTGPLETVLLLSVLELPAWQYGLALALPCLGGLLGSWMAPKAARRLGERRAMVLSAMLRGFPMLALPFLPMGIPGLALYVVATFALLAVAGVFRPLYSAIRMEHTDDVVIARVSTAFMLSALSAGPLFALLGGLVGSLVDLRVALFIGVVGLIASGFFLPTRRAWAAADAEDGVTEDSEGPVAA